MTFDSYAYAEHLLNDMQAAGFPADEDPEMVADFYYLTYDQLTQAGKFLQSPSEPSHYASAHASFVNYEPQTLFGEILKSVVLDGAPRGDQPVHHVACSEAESRLAASVAPDNVKSSYSRSPVVVTRDDQPIGIIKSIEEATVYGITSDAASGLVAGSFASPEIGLEYSELGRRSGAWQIDVSRLGNITPIRFSMFLTPSELRRRQVGRTATEVDHASLTAAAYTMLEAALPVPDIRRRY